MRYDSGVQTIDFHTHAFPDTMAPAAIASLEAEAGVSAFYDGTIADLVAAMDRSGVDLSVVQPVATKPTQVATINEWAAAISGKRIIAFGAMHPDVEDPAAEVSRMHALGLRGFKMHPEYQMFEPDEPRLDPVWAAAAEHGLIAFFHAGADIAIPTVRGTPVAFGRLLDRWPRLTVVLAHIGGFQQWKGVAEILAGRNVWLDTSYTLGHLPDREFVSLVRAHGPDRVLFGSDGPWTDPEAEISWLGGLGLTPVELEDILGRNAARLLDIATS
ncbi:MAG: amidohydrolase [Coriobacteriia bacterium]|nr:amidohydrolase [Coriobacteriia bacterium]